METVEGTLFLREEACSSEIVSLYPVTRVLWQARTAFADAVIAEVPTLGACLFLDREIQSSASDEDIYHECLVHPVMASVPSGRRNNVLVIGGGEGATVREVLKWPVTTVDWVDIDGEVVAACREHLKWGQDAAYTDPRVTYSAQDIRHFLHNLPKTPKYDVIIIDLPDPDPADNPLAADVLMNRAFWCGIKAALAAGGAWVTHAGPVRRGPCGADFIKRATAMADFYSPQHTNYHAVIPAFQDDWGYRMSCRPVFGSFAFPTRFLSPQAYRYIFQWASPGANRG